MDERKITPEEKRWVSAKLAVRERVMALEELQWALGAEMPETFKIPPAWVRSLILRLVVRGRTVENGSGLESIGPDQAGAMDALVTGAFALVATPGESEVKGGKSVDEQRRLRENMGNILKTVLEKSKFRGIRDIRTSAIKTADDTRRYFEAGQRVAEAMSAGDVGSISAQIGYWMWVCWEEAVAAGSRREMHKWISDHMRFIECEWGIFEKVCRQIGYKSGKR